MPPSDYDHTVGIEHLRLGYFMARIFLTVPVEGDLVSPVCDGDLNERFRIGDFVRIVALVFGRSSPKITARHPFGRETFAEDDGIEMLVLIIQRQHASAALREIGWRDPGNQSLVLDFKLFSSEGDRFRDDPGCH